MTQLVAPPTTSLAEAVEAIAAAAERDDREALNDLLPRFTDGGLDTPLADLALRRERIGRLLEALAELRDTPGGAYALGRLDEADVHFPLPPTPTPGGAR